MLCSYPTYIYLYDMCCRLSSQRPKKWHIIPKSTLVRPCTPYKIIGRLLLYCMPLQVVCILYIVLPFKWVQSPHASIYMSSNLSLFLLWKINEVYYIFRTTLNTLACDSKMWENTLWDKETNEIKFVVCNNLGRDCSLSSFSTLLKQA